MMGFVKYMMLAGVLLSVMGALAQSEREHVREGNTLYEQEQYPDAEASYLKALEKNPTMDQGIFNLGDALYEEERFESAAQQFEHSAETLVDPTNKAQAYHNLGNSYLKAEKLPESIEAYKNSLRLNPQDLDTKYNLSYAQAMLKKQQEQEQEEQENEEQENEEQDRKEDKEKDESQRQQSEEGQDDQQKPAPKEENEQRGPEEQQARQGDQPKKREQPRQAEKPKEKGLTKEEAARLLEALLNEEKKVQMKLDKKKNRSTRAKIEKDW